MKHLGLLSLMVAVGVLAVAGQASAQTGACWNGEPLVCEVNTQAECDALGGYWYEDMPCEPLWWSATCSGTLSCGTWKNGVTETGTCPGALGGAKGKGDGRDLGDITVTPLAGNTVEVRVENLYIGDQWRKVAFILVMGHGATGPPANIAVTGEITGPPAATSTVTPLLANDGYVALLGVWWIMRAVILDPQPDWVVLTFDLPRGKSVSRDDDDPEEVDVVFALECCHDNDERGCCYFDDGRPFINNLTQEECEQFLGGEWKEYPCPAVTEWGMMVLTLVLLTGIAIKFGRPKVARNTG